MQPALLEVDCHLRPECSLLCWKLTAILAPNAACFVGSWLPSSPRRQPALLEVDCHLRPECSLLCWKLTAIFLFGLFPIWSQRIKFSIYKFYLYLFLIHVFSYDNATPQEVVYHIINNFLLPKVLVYEGPTGKQLCWVGYPIKILNY